MRTTRSRRSKGESPQALFNCLSPDQAALGVVNSLPDFRNCQVRLSTSNTNATSDQQFLDLTLPDDVWEAPFAHPAGSCTGQRLLGKWAPAESNTAANEGLGVSVLKDTSTHATLGGTCSAPGIGALTPKAFALKVGGSTSCSATSSSAPTVGKLSITMNEINPATNTNYKIQAYVRRTPVSIRLLPTSRSSRARSRTRVSAQVPPSSAHCSRTRSSRRPRALSVRPATSTTTRHSRCARPASDHCHSGNGFGCLEVRRDRQRFALRLLSRTNAASERREGSSAGSRATLRRPWIAPPCRT